MRWCVDEFQAETVACPKPLDLEGAQHHTGTQRRPEYR